MFGSLQVSSVRLQRNTEGVLNDLYMLSLTVLRLLSLMNIIRFPRGVAKKLCESLNHFLDYEKRHDAVTSRLRRLSEEEGTFYRCATELVNVSLLSESEDSDVWVLSQVIEVCSLVGLHFPEKMKLLQAADFLLWPLQRHCPTDHHETLPNPLPAEVEQRPQPQKIATPYSPQPSAGSPITSGQGHQILANSNHVLQM